jgi:putative heme iron utilization protein
MSPFPSDHLAPAGSPDAAAPLEPVVPAQRRSPAEESRTLVARGRVAALATLSDDGGPWSSLVMYAALADGTPVVCLSTLAEHGRNLARDSRASVVIGEPEMAGDPLDSGRVTLAGRVEEPLGAELEQARAAYRDASPASERYGTFGDFTYYVLRIERVRWVGGYGRMDSTHAAAYHAAEPDPVAPHAAFAVRHLNEDHPDALLTIAQVLGGFPDATGARCERADRYGLDLTVRTPRGTGTTRVGFAEPITEPSGLRAAAVALTRRAREV